MRLSLRDAFVSLWCGVVLCGVEWCGAVCCAVCGVVICEVANLRLSLRDAFVAQAYTLWNIYIARMILSALLLPRPASREF